MSLIKICSTNTVSWYDSKSCLGWVGLLSFLFITVRTNFRVGWNLMFYGADQRGFWAPQRLYCTQFMIQRVCLIPPLITHGRQLVSELEDESKALGSNRPLTPRFVTVPTIPRAGFIVLITVIISLFYNFWTIIIMMQLCWRRIVQYDEIKMYLLLQFYFCIFILLLRCSEGTASPHKTIKLF